MNNFDIHCGPSFGVTLDAFFARIRSPDGAQVIFLVRRHIFDEKNITPSHVFVPMQATTSSRGSLVVVHQNQAVPNWLPNWFPG